MNQDGLISVLYLDHTGKLGGAEVALVRLMSSLDRNRFRPIVVFADEGPAPTLMRTTGVETHVLTLDPKVREVRKDTLGALAFLKPRRLLSVIAYAIRISRFVRENQVQIIHTNSLKAHIYGGLGGKLAGVPVVWHLRDFIDTTYLPAAAVHVIRFLIKKIPSHVVTDSQSVMEQAGLKAGSGRATAVRNGVTTAWHPITKIPVDCTTDPITAEQNSNTDFSLLLYAKLPESWNGSVRIGMIGRIAPWKGQHIFLQAAAQLKAKGHKARFLVIGGPLFGEHDYEEKLREMVRGLGIEAEVSFLGLREDVPALLKELDIVVHASTSADPCPSTVLEGMANGLPVIGSDGGGVPEMIVEGETGLLVPMGDASALGDALEKLLLNPAKACLMGRKGYIRVLESFTTARVARDLEKIYLNLVPKLKGSEPTSAGSVRRGVREALNP